MATDNTDDLIISISTDQATLRRSIKRIESDLGNLAGTVKKQFDSVGRTVDNSVQSSLQNRINAMTGIGVKASREWTGALADQGVELERLRAKYSPLFATINNYKSAVSDIRRAHALGAISAAEMTAAISKERQAALAATAAIKGRNAALQQTPRASITPAAGGGSNNFQTGNIAAQFQDIGVTAFGGMSPMTIALQQGTQLSAILSQMRGEGQSTGRALAAAFGSIISPISLVTIGLVAGSAALIQYFTSADSDAEKLKSQLEAQVTLIETVADRWGTAYPALKAYADELIRARDAAQLIDGQTAATSQLFKDQTAALNQLVAVAPEVSRALRDATSPEATAAALAYEQAVTDMRTALEGGKDPSEAFARATQSLATIIDTTGSTALKGYGDQWDALAEKIQGAIQKAGAFRMELPDLGTLSPMWSENGQIIDDSRFIPRDPPTPTRRPTYELDALPKTRKTGSFRASAADNFAEDIQQLRDRGAALQQEMQLIGLTNQAQVERRAALDLEQSALRDLREEARRKGQTDLDSIKLSPEKIATIQAEAAAYAKQSEALRLAQEQQQNLLEWNSEARNVTRGFIGDLIAGEGAARSFANGLSKVGDALIDDVLDGIFKVNGAASGGGGLIGQLLGSVFGGGFKANTTLGDFLTKGYSSGGYTGPGGVNDAAGLVHKGEVVFSQADVARNGGVAATEALRLKGSPTLVAPTAPTLSRANVSGNVTAPIAISIDATGADPAGLARVERQLARLQADLPATVVRTIRNAQARRVPGV